MLGSKVRLNQKVEYHHLIFKIQTPHLLPELTAWVLPLYTHIYCLEQHKQALVLDEICPFVQSLFLFEAPAHTSGRGIDTNGQIIGDEFRKALQWQEHWYHCHPNSVGSPVLINQAGLPAVDGGLQQGGLAWQMLSEATLKAAASSPTWEGLLCHWALPEQQSEASEALRSHQGCPCQPQPPDGGALPGPPGPLTCGYLSAGSTRLSMARTKAAVLPVPDCDWAIRFCGLDPGRTEMRMTSVRNNQVFTCSLWVVGKGIFPLIQVFCLERNDKFFICC